LRILLDNSFLTIAVAHAQIENSIQYTQFPTMLYPRIAAVEAACAHAEFSA